MASHWRAELAARGSTLQGVLTTQFEQMLRSKSKQTQNLRIMHRMLSTAQWRVAAEEGQGTGNWSACSQLLELPELKAVLADAQPGLLEGSALWPKLHAVLFQFGPDCMAACMQVTPPPQQLPHAKVAALCLIVLCNCMLACSKMPLPNHSHAAPLQITYQSARLRAAAHGPFFFTCLQSNHYVIRICSQRVHAAG